MKVNREKFGKAVEAFMSEIGCEGIAVEFHVTAYGATIITPELNENGKPYVDRTKDEFALRVTQVRLDDEN